MEMRSTSTLEKKNPSFFFGSLGAARLSSVLGISLLWPSLHASPYYPFSLSFLFSSDDIALVSAHHALYSVMLVVALIGAAASFCFLCGDIERERLLAAAGGFAGAVGSLLLVVAPLAEGAAAVLAGIATALVALYVGYFLIAWFVVFSRLDGAAGPFALMLSYCLFSVIWLVFLLLFDDIAPVVFSILPAISAFLLFENTTAIPLPSLDARALIAFLAVPLVGLCLLLVYFGVLGVRAMTAMELGFLRVGDLDVASRMIAVVSGLVLACAIAGVLRRKSYDASVGLMLFAVLAVVYIGALLMVVAGENALYGKRVLVGAEHVLEVLLASMLVYETGRKNLHAPVVFAAFGVFVVAIPPFVSLDLMYQSGLLDRLSAWSLVTPLAAGGSFAIAAGSIGLLAAFSSRAVSTANERHDSWQESLCRKATAAFDITPRELDVVVLTYRGLSAKRTAEHLLVSESTVKAHLAHVYRKLAVHSKQELIELIDGYRNEP